MAGAGTSYFNGKVNEYEPIVAALQLLSKPTLTQAEAESLIALHDQSA